MLRFGLLLPVVLLTLSLATPPALAEPAYTYNDRFKADKKSGANQSFLKPSKYKDSVPFSTMKQKSFLPQPKTPPRAKNAARKPAAAPKAQARKVAQNKRDKKTAAHTKTTPRPASQAGSARQTVKLDRRDFNTPREPIPVPPPVTH